MPSKFKKALGAVKDHTSISLAKVSKTATGSSSSHLDLLVLKVTTHDEVLVDERHVGEILHLISSSSPNATACVQSISRRIDRTSSWVVAVKCLHLAFRGLRDGGPHFAREALCAVNRGARLLDLSSFRDESNGTSPWDYTAFVRTFALYLDARLECAARGKLQNRRPITGPNRLCDMKPPVIVDRIAHWQRLLDRAMGTKPTGPARNNVLVHISFQLVVRESFDLYKDVSDGLALLLDSFFQLQHRTCAAVRAAAIRARKQFQELAEFYEACKMMAIGRRSEYPEVQKISEKLLETLGEYVKANQDADPSASPSAAGKGKGPLRMILPPQPAAAEGERDPPPAAGESEQDATVEEQRRSVGSESCALSDLVDLGDDDGNEDSKGNQGVGVPEGQSMSSGSAIVDSGGINLLDLVMFDEMPVAYTNTPEQGQSVANDTSPGEELKVAELCGPADAQQQVTAGNGSSVISGLLSFDDMLETPMTPKMNQWELSLSLTTAVVPTLINYGSSVVIDRPPPAVADSFYTPPISALPQQYTNPFLAEPTDSSSSLVVWSAPTPAVLPPTFSAMNANQHMALLPPNDPFASPFDVFSSGIAPPLDESVRQQLLQQEQLKWMQQQNKIIASRNLHHDS